MPPITYLNFDVRIEREADGYVAAVIDSPAGQASHRFAAPLTQLELELIPSAVAKARDTVRHVDSGEREFARKVGSKLFEAVFAGDVRACLRSSTDEAERQNAGLRIRMRLSHAPDLMNLPWEFAYDQGLNRYLSLSAQTPLVRYLDLPERVRPFKVEPPLRILAVIASPPGLPELNVEDEWRRLCSALSELEEQGLVTIERLPQATWLALQHTLRRQEYHIFHFVGHGQYDATRQEGLLLMLDEGGQGRAISGQDLGMLLHDCQSLRLAVLNACEGARTNVSDPFAGVAQSLVQQGLPAVVAMQFSISDEAAIVLSQEFYKAVSDGYPVDAALSEARRALYGATPGVEWATPVLCLRAPDARIFDMPEPGEAGRRPAGQISHPGPRAQAAARDTNDIVEAAQGGPTTSEGRSPVAITGPNPPTAQPDRPTSLPGAAGIRPKPKTLPK